MDLAPRPTRDVIVAAVETSKFRREDRIVMPQPKRQFIPATVLVSIPAMLYQNL